MAETAEIGLFGAAGRMGAEILALGPEFATLTLSYGYDRQAIGERRGSLTVEALPDALPETVRLMIDFTLAEAVPTHLELTRKARIPYLCGVTGLSEATIAGLKTAAAEIPVLWSPNMSVAMNLMFALAASASRALPDYHRHIIESHHTRKKDAPSGTALRLADSIRDAIHGETEITALRMGDIVGEHRLIFGGPGERLELVHRADSRAVFASGALRAATWLLSKPAGFYSMRDVLGV